MAVERGEGLEFPIWLLALPAGALAIQKVLPSVAEAVPTPPPGVVLSPAYASRTPSGDSVLPDVAPGAEASQAVQAPSQNRVSEAIRAAAHASAVSQAAQRVSAAIETHVRKQVSEQSHPADLQRTAKTVAAAFKTAVHPEHVARETVRIEKKLLAEAEKLKRAGVSATHIETIALNKAKALRHQAEAAVSKATAPLQKAVQKIPAPIRHEAAAAIAPAKRALEKEAGRVIAPLRRQAEKAAVDVAGKLGLDQARKFAGETLQKMKLPNIPVTLPTQLTVDGVKDAVYNSGKQYLEGAMKSAIGFSIPLPKKFSAKEIEKTLTGLLPRDAKEALEKGLDIGTQIGASALSSALVGATIGSAVPGLGTVVGIGVAIGVAALKGVVKKALTEKHALQQRCKAEDKYKVKLPELSPLEMIPWVAQKSFDMSKALAEEEKKTKCGLTPYRSGLRDLAKQSFEISKSTIPVLGAPQLDRLIPLYERAPKQEWFWDKGRIQPGGAIVGGTKKIVFGPSATGYDLVALLKSMKERRAKLANLIEKVKRVEQLAPAELAPLRWDIVTEIGLAATQYQLTGSTEAKAWLGQLGGFMQKIVKREVGAVTAMKTQYEKDLKREAELKKQGKTGVVTGII